MKNRLALFVILASATLTVMAGAIIAPVINIMKDSLGVDQTKIGLIITTHALFIAIFSPIIGSIIDKIGTKKPFVFGLLLYGISGGVGLFIESFSILIASRAILGIAVAFILTPITVMILNLYEGHERNKVMGWRGSANSFGGVFWMLIAGALGGISWHLPFGLYLLGIVLGILAIFTVPETYKEKNGSGTTSIFKVLSKSPVIILMYSLIFWAMMLLYMLIIFLPQLLETMDVTDPFHISIFLMIAPLVGGVVSLNYGRIKRYLDYKKIFFVVLFAWTIGYISISQFPSVFVIMLSIGFFGVAMGMSMPAGMVLLGESVEMQYRGRVVSYLGTFGFIGQFVSPIIFGPISLRFGLESVFLAAGIVNAAFLIAFLTVLWAKRK